MTTAIDRVLGVIFQDLAATGVALPRVDPTPWQVEPSESLMLFAPDGSGTGVWLNPGPSEADGLAHLADQVQEWVIEERARLGQPTNWPACAAHPSNHPLRAVVEQGRAVWACPAGAPTSTPIGELA